MPKLTPGRATVIKMVTLAVMIAGALAMIRSATLTYGVDVPDGPTLSSGPMPLTGTGSQAPVLQGVTRLADVAPRLPDAIARCNENLKNLKADERLSVQKRYDLQDCLYARYVLTQREQDKNIMVRSMWDQASRLDADATDGQLVSAWLHPEAERTAP
jgi:hypothetical protein